MPADPSCCGPLKDCSFSEECRPVICTESTASLNEGRICADLAFDQLVCKDAEVALSPEAHAFDYVE